MSDSDFQSLLEEGDVSDVVRALLGMPVGERRALMRLACDFFADSLSVEEVDPKAFVLLHFSAPEGGEEWDAKLQFAAYRLEQYGIPTLQRSADPYTGDAVLWVRVLCAAALEPDWRAVAGEFELDMRVIPIKSDLLLFDTVSGVGHGRALFVREGVSWRWDV
jgi:hypothetical protein